MHTRDAILIVMTIRHTRGKTVWIDLESPTQDELALAMNEFGIDERVHEEILTPTPYPLAIAFPGYCYLVLHFPTADNTEGTKVQEIDFVVGKDFIITARYEVIDQIHTLHKVLEAEQILDSRKKSHPDELLARIMDRMYEGISSEVEQVGYRLERIERDIFSGKERTAVRSISESARVLLRFETALLRHNGPLVDFLTFLGSPAFFGTKFDEYAAHIEGRRTHSAALVSSYRAIAQELRITNDSLLSASQNQVTKTLTVMAFTALPLTLIASIFGMNAIDMPFVDSPQGFWIILGLMGIAALTLVIYFKLKKWL